MLWLGMGDDMRIYATFMPLAAVALFSLSACGSSSETEVASGTVTDSETGEQTQYQVTKKDDGSGGTLRIQGKNGDVVFGAGADAAQMPKGFTLYPGSKITGGMNTRGEEGQHVVAQFEVAAPLTKVVQHLEGQIQANGLTITTKANQGDTHMIIAENPAGPINNILVTAMDEGGKTSGSFTYTQK